MQANKKTYANAISHCSANGWTLATFVNMDEFIAVFEIISELLTIGWFGSKFQHQRLIHVYLNPPDDKTYVGLINPSSSNCNSLNDCGEEFEWDTSTGLSGTLKDTGLHNSFLELTGEGKDKVMIEPGLKGKGEDSQSENFFICVCDPSAGKRWDYVV